MITSQDFIETDRLASVLSGLPHSKIKSIVIAVARTLTQELDKDTRLPDDFQILSLLCQDALIWQNRPIDAAGALSQLELLLGENDLDQRKAQEAEFFESCLKTLQTPSPTLLLEVLNSGYILTEMNAWSKIAPSFSQPKVIAGKLYDRWTTEMRKSHSVIHYLQTISGLIETE